MRATSFSYSLAVWLFLLTQSPAHPQAAALQVAYKYQDEAVAQFLIDYRRPWTGLAGDTVPGTSWVIAEVRFVPSRVLLIDTSRRLACQVYGRQDPRWQPTFSIPAQFVGVTLKPSGVSPGEPPKRGTPAWYDNLADQYEAEDRFSEARACRISGTGSAAVPTTTTKPAETMFDVTEGGTARVPSLSDFAPPSRSKVQPRAPPAVEDVDTVRSTSGDSQGEVYTTPKGKRYHRFSCHHVVAGTATARSVSDAQVLGYTPCKVCRP